MEVTTESYQLKWHSFSSHIHGCIANYLNTDCFSDTVLFTMDGHQILAHRFVLSSCSQYFNQILKFQYKLATSLPLVIVMPPEITYNTLKILTQYMYTGETTVSKDILENVLRGGDLLKVKGLWRPRDEEYQDKRPVKVHQRIDETKQQNSAKNTPKLQEGKHCEVSEKNEIKTKNNQNVKQDIQPEHSIKTTEASKSTKEQPKQAEKISSDKKIDETSSSSDNLQFIVIKEEPLEWSEVNESDMELIDESDMFHTEMTIKPEVVLDDPEESTEEIYSPLTCELCAETFRIPADWVKHIQSHTDMMPAKRQRRGRPSCDEDSGTFPPLHCDMCQTYFPTPAEWVHHIQNTHTEFELRLSNKTCPVRPIKVNRQIGPFHKTCTVCNKKFPSHASMIIHKRTHTGEKPYMCKYCYKGFNVKSNLLRHLRTLHDKIINSTDIESNEECGDGESVSVSNTTS